MKEIKGEKKKCEKRERESEKKKECEKGERKK